MMMVLSKNLISNISDKNIKHSQNGSECKIEPFFLFLHTSFLILRKIKCAQIALKSNLSTFVFYEK